MKRKTFIKNSIGGLVLAGVAPAFAISQIQKNFQTQVEPRPIDIKLVKDFVSAGHKNLPLVKEMLHEHPNLIYARYDWGSSDFEEAIEGAGHLGNKEIANYLISQGARVFLYVAELQNCKYMNSIC